MHSACAGIDRACSARALAGAARVDGRAPPKQTAVQVTHSGLQRPADGAAVQPTDRGSATRPHMHAAVPCVGLSARYRAWVEPVYDALFTFIYVRCARLIGGRKNKQIG